MKRYLSYLKQRMWLMVLPLLLMVAYGGGTLAGPTPSFSASTSGTTNNLSLTATINVSDADVGKNGNIYLGFEKSNVWYFNMVTGWVPYVGGPLPIYISAPLTSRTIDVVRNVDMSTLLGGKLYVGYGLTDNDMFANGKYAMVYTATADTTAPTVTGTFHANGATNVPINTKVGATFSEAIEPASINTDNFTLQETISGTLVAGTVSYSGVNAIFTPAAPLIPSTRYIVTVKGGVLGVKDLAGNRLASDFVISWTTSASLDVTAPTVSGTINAAGATNVPINTKIGATFSEAMDPLTINSSTFTVKEGTKVILGTVTYSGVTAVFSPFGDLGYNATHTATLSTGAKDLAGNALASDYVWSWLTAPYCCSTEPVDIVPPTVTGTIQANGATNIAINTAAGATFSEGMDPLSMTNLTFTLKETVSGTAVAGTVSYSGVNAVFTPLANLTPSTAYTVTVKGGVGGVKDLAGNALASDYIIGWTTAAAPDTTPPTVVSTIPVDGAVGSCINKSITASFSEAMDPLTITTATFTLDLTAGGTVAGLVTYDALTKIATFTPSANLAATSGYTAKIIGGVSGAKDLAGNALAVDKVTTFTTNAATCALAPVLLGTAGNFAILAKTAISTVPTSVVTGDIGLSPAAASFITGFTLIADGSNVFSTSTQVVGGGKVYAADMAVPSPANMTTAISDMETAYTDAAGRITPDFLNLGSGNIGGLTLAPGLYKWGTSVTIPTDVVISGSATDIWIFQMSGDLTMSSAKNITLSGGALAKNIFWQVAGQVTIGTTAHFEGNILSQTAVTLLTGSSMNGRVLAQSQVALQSATVTKPAP